MRSIIRSLALGLVLVMALAACSSEEGSTESGGDAASVSFGGISDGDTVTSPVAVDFQTTNFTIEEAGEVNEGAGHMHVMVDTGCVPVGETIPGDSEQHIHFGDGSTSTELELEPGEHTLCLQAGDGAHTALDLTDEITITVE